MDWDMVQKLIVVAGLIIGAWRYLEMRLQSLKGEVMEKLEDRNKLNEEVQRSLKEDIARLESKVESSNQMLMQLLTQVSRQEGRDGPRN